MYGITTTRDNGHYYFGLRKKWNDLGIVSRAIEQFDHEFDQVGQFEQLYHLFEQLVQFEKFDHEFEHTAYLKHWNLAPPKNSQNYLVSHRIIIIK